MNCTFRKFVVLIIGALLLGLVSMLPIRTIKANYNTDVTCAFMDSTQYENVNAGGGYYQTFYPSESRLTSAVMTLAAFQTDSTATMKLLSENGTELATQSLTVTGADPVERHLYSFDGFDAVTVTPGAMYKLVLIKSAGTTLYWYKSTTCAIQGNGYANGTSFPGMDYVFTTYGYTPAEPAPTPEETQIAAPTKVTAEYVLDGNKVKVGWEKTTTEAIDGYRIYRSTDKTKGFAKVGQVVKEEKEFFDITFSANKTYYYYVTAYKDLNEGVKSNTAQVVIPASATTKKTTPISSATKEKSNWLIYVILGGVGLLLIAFFIVYELKLKKLWLKKKEERHNI